MSSVFFFVSQDNELFSKDGLPHPNLQCNWKGKNGLYSAGFGRKGLVGTSMDAQKIAMDINKIYRSGPKASQFTRFLQHHGYNRIYERWGNRSLRSPLLLSKKRFRRSGERINSYIYACVCASMRHMIKKRMIFSIYNQHHLSILTTHTCFYGGLLLLENFDTWSYIIFYMPQ